ncbi:MAG: stage II sporulation protein E [Firmicutes bacterium]|nr:stage II sporulation protein E [Bacillota bacterium]
MPSLLSLAVYPTFDKTHIDMVVESPLADMIMLGAICMNFGAKPQVAARGKPLINKNDIASALVGVFGFFIGRAMVFTFVSPLALPFLAVFMGAGKGFYLTATFLALGLLTRLGQLLTMRYLLAISMLCTYYFLMTRITREEVRQWLKLPYVAAVTAGAILFSGLIFATAYGRSPFLLTVTILETVLAGGLTLILKRAHVILTGRRRRAKLLSGEDITALTIVLAGVIAGASDIYVGAMPLRIFFCVYVLCIVSFKGGASMSAAAGMLLGLFLHLAGYWDSSWAAILGLAGLGGGFVRQWGRPAVIAGVGIIGGAAVFILARSWIGFSMVYAVIAGGMAFVITPHSFYFNVASAINPVLDSADDYMDKIKEETTRRLDSFASAFEKLADTFSGLSTPKTALNKHDITLLVDDVASRVCGGCSNMERCWEEDLYNTHQQIYSLLNACSARGAAATNDMHKQFYNSCKTPEALVSELNAVFNLYKNDLRWHNRISETRELISQQLHGVSGIVKCLSDEIDMSLRFHEGLEEEMIMALLRQKVEVSSVIVLEDNGGKYKVSISHKACMRRKSCTKEMIPVLNAVLKRKMRIEGADCDIQNGICRIRFMEDQKLRITSGVAHRAKSAKGSGDSYSAIELRNGSCLLALSDGMGSGERARRESAATVGLLEDFIESGFDKELAVRMINTVLVLKSSEESFSTLDICAVDLYTGQAEFIKIGAAEAYVMRGGHVSVIRSSSLPIGMLNDVDLEVTKRDLKHDDIIVMATDGVTSADKEDWIKYVLKNCRYGNPQDVADHLLFEAVRRSEGTPKDDMTVLAARVWEKV